MIEMKLFPKQKIDSVMNQNIVQVNHKSTVKEAALTMKAKGLDKILVVDNSNKSKGILDLYDIKKDDLGKQVKEITLTKVVKVEVGTTLEDAYQQIMSNPFVVVTKKNKPIGIVTKMDYARKQKLI